MMEIFMLLLRNEINKIEINEIKTQDLIQIYLRLNGPKWYPIQFSSVAQSCPTFHNPMSRSTPGLPVNHQLPEFTQTHVVPFSFCPQSLPASGSFPMTQLFAWGGQNTGVSALQRYPRADLLQNGLVGTPWSPRDSQESSPTSLFWKKSALGFLWREWYCSWNSSTSAISCEELTH